MTSNTVKQRWRHLLALGSFPFERSFELWSGRLDGQWRYFVDYVERDGCRAGMWDGLDLGEARQAARECGAGGGFPVLDLTGAEPIEIPTGAIQ